MKRRDIVTVHDGSWSISIINGSLGHVSENGVLARRFRVLDTGGRYATEDHGEPGIKRNDIMLIDENDSGRILFTRQAYCRIVTPAPSSPCDTMDLTIPRGVTTVNLHFEP